MNNSPDNQHLEQEARGRQVIRVLTYNIHSCMNSHGQGGPETVAEVIRGFNADLIALQEVDAEGFQSKSRDQARLIAEKLNMNHIFFPVEDSGMHAFGLALLSRFSFKNVYYNRLPRLYARLKINIRKRGAMRAVLQTPAGPIHVFNTHLSLFKLERRKQMRVLLGQEWLSSVPSHEPVIFCGDLNAGPASPVYRKLSHVLTDVQNTDQIHHPPRTTFHSRSPFKRIDHIFVSNHFQILNSEVSATPLAQKASDHLPLFAELAL